MTEHDDLMDAIRRARPDDLASARTPAAQALLEEILSMHVTQAPEVVVVDPTPVGPRRSRRRQLAFGGIAAAVLAIVVLVVDSGEQTSAATVEAAMTRLSSTLEQSGRAEVRWRAEWDRDEPFVQTGVDSWELAGHDSSVTSRYSVNGVADSGEPVNRYVDGEWYYYVATAGNPDDGYRWYHDVGSDADQRPGFNLDPTTLLDELHPAGGFEEVADETVDGIETTRYRATDPERTPVPDLGVGVVVGDTVTSLEVWVDHDGVMRRLDLVTTGGEPTPADLVLRTASISVRFADLAEPITIEAPTDFEDRAG